MLFRKNNIQRQSNNYNRRKYRRKQYTHIKASIGYWTTYEKHPKFIYY